MRARSMVFRFSLLRRWVRSWKNGTRGILHWLVESLGSWAPIFSRPNIVRVLDKLSRAVLCLWLWLEDPSLGQRWARFKSPTTQFKREPRVSLWVRRAGKQTIQGQ